MPAWKRRFDGARVLAGRVNRGGAFDVTWTGCRLKPCSGRETKSSKGVLDGDVGASAPTASRVVFARGGTGVVGSSARGDSAVVPSRNVDPKST